MANSELRVVETSSEDIDLSDVLAETAKLRHFGPAWRIGSTGLRAAVARSHYLIERSEIGRLLKVVRSEGEKRGLDFTAEQRLTRHAGVTEGPSRVQTLEIPEGGPHAIRFKGATALTVIGGELEVCGVESEQPDILVPGESAFVFGKQPEVRIRAEGGPATAILVAGQGGEAA